MSELEDEIVTYTREIQFPHFTIRIEEDDTPPELIVDPPGLLDRRCFLVWKDELIRVSNVREIGVRVGIALVAQDLQSDLEMSTELLAVLCGVNTRPLPSDASFRRFMQREGYETTKLVTHCLGGVLTSYADDQGEDDWPLFQIEVALEYLTTETRIVADLWRANELLVPTSSLLSLYRVQEEEFPGSMLMERDTHLSELYQGRIYRRHTTSLDHDRISLNLWEFLDGQLKERGGQTYAGNIRVLIQRPHRESIHDALQVEGQSWGEIAKFRYSSSPDIVVICGEPKFHDQEEKTILNPTLLIEIFSPLTEDRDRGLRSVQYRRCPSLREYLVVSEVEPFVEQYVRRNDGQWELSTTTGLNADLRMPSINCEISLRVLFDEVAFSK